jgi:hypothetical protein
MISPSRFIISSTSPEPMVTTRLGLGQMVTLRLSPRRLAEQPLRWPYLYLNLTRNGFTLTTWHGPGSGHWHSVPGSLRSPGHGHRDWHGVRVAGRRPRRWLATVKAEPIVAYHLKLRLTAGSRTESRWAYLIMRSRQSESLESGRGPGPKPTGTAPT